MSVSIFVASDYRAYLKAWIEEQNQRGLLSKIAQEIGCQNSHLSRVLKQEVHLTSDQAFGLTEFMKMTEMETQFFIRLVEYERSGSLRYKNKIKSELKELKQKHDDISHRFKNENISNKELEMLYYSDWVWSAIHILTDSPNYQTVESLASRLNLDVQKIKYFLETLESFGLVKRKNAKWENSSASIHLPKKSPMNPIQHLNWRQRAVLKSQNLNTDGIHYTVIQTITKSDFEKIKQILFSCIESYKKTADASGSEDAICFSCDFFWI